MREELTSRRAAGLAIRCAATPNDVELARRLFVEYAQWLKIDLCFQGFDRELATLPGAYSPPRGRLLLAGDPEDAFGCVALRPLDSAWLADSDVPAASIGEVKRLYVQPAHRGGGWGRRLAESLIGHAREIGYTELRLDTLGWLDDARKLYAALGFREREPYYVNPMQGMVYMTLAL